MNGLNYLVESGKLTAAQAGYLGVTLNVLLAVGLILLAAWGWNYNDQISQHNCAAVCRVLTPGNGITYYPRCDAGEDIAAFEHYGWPEAYGNKREYSNPDGTPKTAQGGE